MKMRINDKAKALMKKLEKGGFSAYIVGGCVRDMLLNRIPGDWDMTTNARPEEIQRCFKGYPMLTIGLKHGTVTVRSGEEWYEITTHRIDGEYEDYRKPKRVTYTDKLKEDLSRRDFTINALAYDLSGELYDFYGGQEDIKNHVIRCVGNPSQRFSEDALRILRALRFSAQLGFAIEESTRQAIFSFCHLLTHISQERIGEEFLKLVLGRYAAAVLKEYQAVFSVFLPEVAPVFDYSDFLQEFSIVPREYTICLALMINKIQTTKVHQYRSIQKECSRYLVSLALSHAVLRQVVDMVFCLRNLAETDDKITLKKVLNQVDIDGIEGYLAYLRQTDSPKHCRILAHYREVVMNHECYLLRKLAVSGNDIKAMIPDESCRIGDVLSVLLDFVIRYPDQNIHAILLKQAEKVIREL